MENEGDLTALTEVKLVPGPTMLVKNKMPPEDKILQPPPPKKHKIIIDAEELAEYRWQKRKEFEDMIPRVPWNNSNTIWMKYAQWEEHQNDLPRARNIWERAIKLDYTNPTLWLKYTDMEMRSKCVNHARNVWDRAVSVLPQVDQLWYKYIHMEEVLLGNIDGARQIFERWMLTCWKPDHHGWVAYIEFELWYNEINRAKSIYYKCVECHFGNNKAWMWYMKFEEVKNGDIVKARECYERAIMEHEQLGGGDDGQKLTEEVFGAFAQFEERCNELERARVIYTYALHHLAKDKARILFQKFVQFKIQYRDIDY